MKFLLNGDLNMRLYNVYYVCKAALNGLKELKRVDLTTGSIKLNEWEICKMSIESLFNIDFVERDAYELYNIISPIDREKQQPDIGINTYNTFMSSYKKLITKLEGVIDLYESMRDGTSKPGIDIKIPSCDSLKEYIKILNDIDFILTQCPYLKNENEEIKYQGTDVGSDWITFAIIMSSTVSASFVILNNLASLMNKAIQIKSNKKVLDMQDELLKSMQLKNEATQETLGVFKTLKEITYKKYVDELKEELGDVKDGEEEGRVSKSLEKLANLIDKGVEIHTSVETPKEIKVLFPFVEPQQSLPDGLLKYIEDKSSSRDNE